jgi:hypothetical protein
MKQETVITLNEVDIKRIIAEHFHVYSSCVSLNIKDVSDGPMGIYSHKEIFGKVVS